MSPSEQAAYYRGRCRHWKADLEDGTMEPAEARGWIVHDLTWARYWQDVAEGKTPPTPTVKPEPIYTLDEAVELMPEDVDVGDPDDVYSL